MSDEIEIRIHDNYIQFFHNDDLIYESETTAQSIFMIEGLLSTLDYNVSIGDFSTQDTNEEDEKNEPYYEEISFIDSED